jgi:hypothetical protein
MPSSLPRWNCRVRLSHLFPCNTGLPRVSVRSASTTSVSRPHRAFTCVTACIFAGSPSDPFHRRLRRIRCLLRRFDCYWASDPSQAGLPPARIHTHSRRTDRSDIGKMRSLQTPCLHLIGPVPFSPSNRANLAMPRSYPISATLSIISYVSPEFLSALLVSRTSLYTSRSATRKQLVSSWPGSPAKATVYD